MNKLRKCKTCKVEKYISEYYKNGDNYYKRNCKKCYIEKRKYKKMNIFNKIKYNINKWLGV